MGKSKTTNTTVQNTSQQRDPYAAAIPGLQSAGSGVTAWMNNPANAQAYSGPRVAQMSDRTGQGLDAMFNSTGAKTSESYLTDAVNGKYTSTDNPYLTQLQNSIRSSVMPSINARVSSSGMAPGSSVDQNLVATGLGNAMAQPLFTSYENERNRQQQAAGMLPGVSQQINQNMIGAGQMGEAYNQANIDAARQAWEENRVAGLRPYAEALPLLSTIGGAGGTSSSSSTGTQTQSTTPSLGQSILGAGMMGASMFSPMGMFGSSGAFGNPMSWFGGGSSLGMPGGTYAGINDPGGRAY